MIWSWLLPQDRVHVSRDLRDHLGWHEASHEITPDEWFERIPEAERGTMREQIEALVDGDADTIAQNHRLIGRDGEEIHIHDRVFLIRSEDGDPTRLIGSITETPGLGEARSEIDRRVRQQSLLADLAGQAVAEDDLDDVLELATVMLTAALDVEYVKLLEHRPVHDDLLLRAGTGWEEGLVGELTVPDAEGSQAGYTMLQRGPVVVSDLEAETRFEALSLLTDHGVRSGLSIPIQTSSGPWGVLGADSTQIRRFSEEDVDLFTSVASIVGAAIDRHQAQERFELASEATNDVLWDFDPHTDALWFSPRMETVFGWNPDEVETFTAWSQKVHPDDLPDVLEGIDAWFERGTGTWEATYRFRRADGTWAHVHDHAALVTDDEGEPVRAVGSIQDRTEETQAQRQVQLQARMLDQVGQAVIATNVRGEVTFWNEAAEELYGWSAEEALGRDVMKLTVPEENEDVAAEIMAQLVERGTWTGQFEVKRRDGTTFPAIVTDAPILDDEGQLAGVIGTTTDITEQKAAEQAAEDSRARLDHLITEAPAVIFTADPEPPWDVTWMCPNTKHVLGEEAEPFEADPQRWWDAIPPADRERVDAILNSLPGEGKVSLEHRWKANGQERWLRSDLRLVHRDEGEPWEIVGSAIDITDRVLAEGELAEAERRKSAILAAIPDMVFRLDRTGTFREFFPGTVEPVLPPDEFLGRPIPEILPEDVADLFLGAIEEGLETGEVQEIEYTLEEGQAARFEARIAPAGEDQVVSVVRDVTQRHEAIEALEESEQRFRDLAENIDSVFWVTTPQMAPAEYISPAFEEIWGIPIAEAREDPTVFFDAVHPEDRAKVETFLDVPVRTRTEVEYRVIQPGGEVRWIHDRAFPVEDDDGEIVRVVGIAEDITDRVEAQEALKESEQRFRELAEAIDSVFWLVPADRSKGLYVSPAFEEIWGVPSEALSSGFEVFFDAIHPEDQDRFEAYLDAQHDGDAEAQYRIVRPDGEVRWIHDRAFPVTDEDGELLRVAGIAEDITGRKQLEQELRESNERLEATTSAAPMVLFAIDPEGTFLVSRGAGLEAIGHEPGESVGKNLFDVYSHNDELLETTRKALSGEIDEATVEEGGRWWQTRYRRSFDENGAVDQLVGVSIDVTERVEAEDALDEQKRRLGFALEGLPLILFTVSPEGRFTLAQGRGLEHLDLTPEDAVGRHVSELYSDNDQVMDLLDRALQGVETTEPIEVGDRVFQVQTAPAFDEDGELEAMHGLAVDVTEQVETEAELSQRDEMLHQLSENVDAILWLASPDLTEIEYVSPAFERLLGLDPDQFLEDPATFMENVHPEDRPLLVELFSDPGRAVDASPFEYRVHDADGRVRWFRTSLTPVQDASGTIERFVGVTNDVTAAKDAQEIREERVRAEAEVERLREIDRFKTEFLNTTAHELSNPLTPIRFQIEALRSGMLGDLNDRQDESVQLLERNFHRLRRLVDDLLDTARLQQGRLKIQRDTHRLDEIVREVLGTMGPKAEEASVELGTGEVATLQASVDRERVGQVLVNLVDNAVKYTPRGGRVTVSLRQEEGGAVLEVADTGIGMRSGQLADLFTPFRRVHERGAGDKPGTGLGLYISKGLAEAHGGTILAESDGPGRGSTFTVRLPLTDETGAEGPSRTEEGTPDG